MKSVAIEPARWLQTKWAADIGGFWAIAVESDRVLWYNEYEEGFNVSRFTIRGVIPDDQYWCNQDPICLALPELATGENPNGHWGPPEPLSNAIPDALSRLWKALFRR